MEERERCTNQIPPRRGRTQAEPSGSNQPTRPATGRAQANTDKDTNKQTGTGGTGELGLKSFKCFGCHKKGHVVSEFPEKKNKESARMIHAEDATRPLNTYEAAVDPWIRVLTASKEVKTVDDHSAKLHSGTYIQGRCGSKRCQDPSISG